MNLLRRLRHEPRHDRPHSHRPGTQEPSSTDVAGRDGDEPTAMLTARLASPLDCLLGQRCPARLPRGVSGDGHHGRCELRAHRPTLGHALERGAYWVRWTSDPTRPTWVTT